MFNFLKKTDEKMKEQVDQIQIKDRRLKIRRSKVKEKLPSGITADYSAPFLAKLDVYHESNRDNSEEIVSVNTTMQIGENSNKSLTLSQSEFSESSRLTNTLKMHVKHTNHLIVKTSPTISTESLTDSTNSIFATPPLSPIGESHGFYSIAKTHSLQELNFSMPAIKLIDLPKPRKLTISRQNNSQKDFGFSLRKANIVLNRSNSQFKPTFKSVIFAEPGTNCKTTGLLPGDRLITLNEIAVEDLPREEIIDMIKNSGDTINVVVQPVAELSELSKRCMPSTDTDDHLQTDYNTLKRSASKRLKIEKLRNTNMEDISTVEEQVWINFNSGFCKGFARKIPSDESTGKLQVRFLHNNEKIIVDEDNVEKSNPESLDFCEDISQLKYLNEISVLHSLRQRYANNLIHTYAGAKNLLVINPMIPLSLYSEKVVSMFRGCKADFGILDMPPHIYSLTQSTYSEMLQTRKNQSIVFMGRSGAGKTTNFKHAILYLTLSAGSVQKFLTVEKVNAIQLILEYFGNTTNDLNSNATRFTQIFSLDFDNGVIASASIKIYMLEALRAGKTFQILRLLGGLTENLKKSLYMENYQENPFIHAVFNQQDERVKAEMDLERINKAFSILKIEKEAAVVWNILAAIYHLGIAGVDVDSNRANQVQFANSSAAKKAASLLGVSIDNLNAAAFVVSPQTMAKEDILNSAWESIEGLVSGLYSTAMASIVSLINNSISTSTHTNTSIFLIDSPGFQNPATCGKQILANLDDIKHNYLQERLQLLFKKTMEQKRKLYSAEKVEIDTEDVQEISPAPLVALLDKSPSNFSSITTQHEAVHKMDRQTGTKKKKKGLFWILDEESTNSKSSDEAFLDVLFDVHNEREDQNILSRVGKKHFILQHMQGTNPVLYSVTGWLNEVCREPLSIKAATKLLQHSSKSELNELLMASFASRNHPLFHDNAVFDGIQSIRSLQRSGGMKTNSTLLKIKSTVDGIIDIFQKTEMHFVHSFLVHHQAGKTSLLSPNKNTMLETSDDLINIPLLRSQLRGSQTLEAARLHRFGYQSMPKAEFVQRFRLLGGSSIEQIISSNDIDSSSYRNGLSQIFLRLDVLNQLEAKRDDIISDSIKNFQSFCRGYLSRKMAEKRRVHQLAIKCIQRNVRVFLSVRYWKWWKLYTKVVPLLNGTDNSSVHLKNALEEQESLKKKLAKMEEERNLTNMENVRLKMKISEMSLDLVDEHSTANVISECLEAETTERLRLEQKCQNMKDTAERFEKELHLAKSDLNGIVEDDDGLNDDCNVYKIKYESAAKELEFTKKRLHSQHEHDLEQLVGLKKQLEKKLADSYEELDEQRQVVQQWKKKTQKIANDSSDLRLLLEEQNNRNIMLEKRQKKFDSECQVLQDAAKQEKVAKEQYLREKDAILAEKYHLEQKLAESNLELEFKENHLKNLKDEFEETFNSGTEEELNELKRTKLSLNRLCKQQEIDIDELTNTLELLEKSKLKLELELETNRKEHKKELQNISQEADNQSIKLVKKVKALELELETEYTERSLLVREKLELDRVVTFLQNQAKTDADHSELTQKLKRDLKKYKALLHDARLQLENSTMDAESKSLIRQLKHKLEDVQSSEKACQRAKSAAETELLELNSTMEDVRAKNYEIMEMYGEAQRNITDLQAQTEETEIEMGELIKKYQKVVAELNEEQKIKAEYEMKILELENQKSMLKDRIAELDFRLENTEDGSSVNMQNKRLELRIKELESKIDIDSTTKSRVDGQINRFKSEIEKLKTEISFLRAKDDQSQETLKKMKQKLQDLREQHQTMTYREQETNNKYKDMEKRMNDLNQKLQSDLRFAQQRIADLQMAIENETDVVSESDLSDSSNEANLDEETGIGN